MKKEFVRTDNDKRFRTALKQKESRGAAESGLIVVHGRAGEGKTRTLHNWASSCNAVMLTANPAWTVRRMMVELAEQFQIVVKGPWEAALEARIGAEEVNLVIDEAGFALADNAACLERLRSITDKSGTLLVMAVMERDMARLKQHDQITSRATLCPFGASTLEDVKTACAQLTTVVIEADLAERIWRDSGARMRLIVEGIHLSEKVALAAGKASVGTADLAGFSLCEDFNLVRRTPNARGGKA